MIKIKDGFKGERSLVVPRMITEYMERDALLSQLYITAIGYYPKAQHHYIERNEPIGECVFIYCVEGEGWIKMHNSTYHLHAFQFMVIPFHFAHAYAADEQNPWTIYWMHFKGALARVMADGLNRVNTVQICENSRINNRIQLFEEIFFTIKTSFSKENLLYAHSILYHFIGSLKYVSQYREAAQRREESANEKRNKCNQAIHFMKENIESHISLVKLAQYVGYTPNHFATLFKNQIGHAPLTYFNLLKMQSAASMLDSTDMKINQIASKLGYEDSGYFTRLFTKIMGLSPTAYRLTLLG